MLIPFLQGSRRSKTNWSHYTNNKNKGPVCWHKYAENLPDKKENIPRKSSVPYVLL